MWLAIAAAHALALRSALNPCSEALAVVFAAVGLLAGASACWYVCGYSFEVAGVAVVCHLFRPIDHCFIALVVLAAHAHAAPVALPSLREAFTVQLQTVYFGALAARMVILFLLV